VILTYSPRSTVEEKRERYEGVVSVPLSKDLFFEQMNEVAITSQYRGRVHYTFRKVPFSSGYPGRQSNVSLMNMLLFALVHIVCAAFDVRFQLRSSL